MSNQTQFVVNALKALCVVSILMGFGMLYINTKLASSEAKILRKELADLREEKSKTLEADSKALKTKERELKKARKRNPKYFHINISSEFLYALARVESSLNPRAVGDGGKAVGLFQITMPYLKDCNRILKSVGVEYYPADRFIAGYSVAMVRTYLDHWGRKYEARFHKPVTYEVLAKIHNGGPYWVNRCSPEKARNLDRYWNKVRTELNEIFSKKAL